MLSASTMVALSGLSKASRAGYKAKKLHKLMRSRKDLWFQAYANIYSNHGALTKGIDKNTLDGFGEERVHELMKSISEGAYKPSPVRRIHIPKDSRKPHGKKRPLGIPRGDDKLVQEVARMLLEAVYEPVFSEFSHGFRPQRSCHTALQQVIDSWKGTKWVCDVDIKGFFDNIVHDKLLAVLAKRIDDRRFLRLIEQFLKAGYLEDWRYHATYSGTPQGGIVSPILANVFLHELDVFMEVKKRGFDQGKRRRKNKEYHRLLCNISNRKKWLKDMDQSDPKAVKWNAEIVSMAGSMAAMPSVDMHQVDFKRPRYVRYADDFLIGVVGTKADAVRIMAEVKAFVESDLLLTISEEKSSLGSLEDGCTFLGYGVRTRRMDKRMKCVVALKSDGTKVHGTKRTITSHVHLSVPEDRVRRFAESKGYATMHHGRTGIRWKGGMLHMSDYEIISQYNAELRGFANYYALAPKYYLSKLEWVAHSSLFRTLARKHNVTPAKVIRWLKVDRGQYRYTYSLNGEKRKLPVFRLRDRQPPTWVAKIDAVTNTVWFGTSRTELLARLAARRCEYCNTNEGPFQVHHVRKLADIAKGKATWQKLMIARRRKTLVLCQPCHVDLHRGTLPDRRFAENPGMESRMH